MKTPAANPNKDSENEESLERQRETFVASLSHDLKNPTIAQIRALELVLKGCFGKVLPQQREIMEMVLDSCKYMYSMLASVLETYRTEKGTVSLSNEKVSIAELASECIEEMIFLARDKGLKICFINTADQDFVYGDRVQIKRVIINLLSNGIKYAFNETVLNVCVYNEKNNTCFRFENFSPYLPPEKQEKVFAKYVSFSHENCINGIGLGLYASQKIILAHGGTMFVKSYEDNRNTFGFKIPNDESTKFKQKSVTF